ncbi:MAG: DUF697 domain-containing protein [Myxococcota bacterium]
MGYAETVQRVLQGNYEGASPAEKATAVREIVQVCSVAAAAATIQPIPFLDFAIVTPIQVGMVRAIGKIHGRRLDQQAVVELLASFGASIVAQNAVMAASKFVPMLGWLVAPSMAYAMTWAIGEVSDRYFRGEVGEGQLRAEYERVYREKKAEKESAHRGDQTLKQRLEQLTEARAAGLLSEEEYERKKQEILASF